MDFARTFHDIETALAGNDIVVAVVGGVALAAYGHPRMTLDLDLLADGDKQGQVLDVMAALGFEMLHRSTGYSNHLHAIRHDPSRLWQDMADIAYLVRIDGVDREEVRGYFIKAGLEDKWRELEAHL